MRFSKLIIISLLTHAITSHAADCTSSSANPNLISPNFPKEECSFNSLSVNPQNLRFGNLTFGGADDNDDGFFENAFVNLGSRLYQLDENVEIYDARDDDADCNFNEDDFVVFDESVAIILSDDSLNAPRVITQMWLLDCDIDTTR